MAMSYMIIPTLDLDQNGQGFERTVVALSSLGMLLLLSWFTSRVRWNPVMHTMGLVLLLVEVRISHNTIVTPDRTYSLLTF